MPKPPIVRIPLDTLTLTKSLQRREAEDKDRIAAFADLYRADPKALPPVVVFSPNWSDPTAPRLLADGWHRTKGARKADLTDIEVEQHTGDARAAKFYALGANGAHGLPTTMAERKANCEEVLADLEWRNLSDREIATHVHLSPQTVGRIRKAVGAVVAQVKGRDGVTRKKGQKAKAAPVTQGTPEEPGDANIRRVTAAIQQNPLGLPAIKAAIIATIAYWGCVQRDDLAAILTRLGYGPPDVHPGQLIRAGLVRKNSDDAYCLTEDGKALAVDPQDKSAPIAPTTPGPVPAGEPETLTLPTDTPPPPPTPAPKASKRKPLADRRADWIRDTLADRIARAHTFAGTAKEGDALILLCGTDTDETDLWSESFVQGASHALQTRLAANVAHRIRTGDGVRLPDWRTLARLWGIDYDELTILADRSIPE